MRKYCLDIGGLNISIDMDDVLPIEMQIPLHFRAFLEDIENTKDTPDMNLTIRRTISENIEKDALKLVSEFKEGITPYSLYEMKSGKKLWTLEDNILNEKTIYSINENWNDIEMSQPNNNDMGQQAFVYFGNIFAYSILQYNALMFHGIVMEHNGKGIIISASSGTGKTTHARMWRDHKNALILNGDRALCRKVDDTWYAYGSPWFGSSGESINRKVPITAIVILERGQENKVTRVSELDAAMGLMPRIFAPKWDEQKMDKALDIMDEIISEVPVLRLECRPDVDAVETLYEFIDKM